MRKLRKQKTGDLIITVPWKTYVGHILQEEAFIEPLKALSDKQIYAERQRLKEAGPESMDIIDFLDMLAAFRIKPYADRRAQRLGRKDPKGDERLGHARAWAALEMVDLLSPRTMALTMITTACLVDQAISRSCGFARRCQVLHSPVCLTRCHRERGPFV